MSTGLYVHCTLYVLYVCSPNFDDFTSSDPASNLQGLRKFDYSLYTALCDGQATETSSCGRERNVSWRRGARVCVGVSYRKSHTSPAGFFVLSRRRA